jgi:hypothetical protein
MKSTHTQQALHCTSDLEAFMNLIVCATHEDQFQASVQAMAQIKQLHGDVVQDSLNKWPSIFTGHSWIINRKTPAHRDSGGFISGFDYLSIFGTASSIIKLRDINITAQYNPGTVVALPGKVLVHEVEGWRGGNRVCVARWIRRRVLKTHGVADIAWPKIADFTTRFQW